MVNTQDSLGCSPELIRPLPPQFENVQAVYSMPSERLKQSPLVNVIALVKDYMPPIPTKGTDFKCTLHVVDLSTQEEWGKGIQVVIFRPEENMPKISGVRDIVILRNMKVQMWDGYVSLLTNWSSAIHVFHATTIPPWPRTNLCLSSNTASGSKSPVSRAEMEYAAWLFHHIDKALFPDVEEFRKKSQNALKTKEKFSYLKDIKAQYFYDLIGEVIRVYEIDGRVTMYISDYTAHSLFYDNVWRDGREDSSSMRDGDQYGYTKSRKNAQSDWPGPYGKLSLQLTLYDSHAGFVREKVKNGDWLLLKNVQIKMGNQGGCLEGFLRGDRDGWEDKVQIQIIRKAEDAEMNDARWKEGLRRKKEWWDRFNKKKRKILEEAKEPTGKQQLDVKESSKTNSKKRRKEKLALVEQKRIATEQRVHERLDLNSNVRCNHPDQTPVQLWEILEDISRISVPSSGLEVTLPFKNVKYRANVRVVNYWPHKLEDFAVGRRASEFDVLSDFSGGETTDNEEEMRQLRHGKGFGGEKTWQWRFALQVANAGERVTDPKECIWLIVDNDSAQMLLNMDAENLRQNKEKLDELREVLFTLWGDLEEKKSEYMKAQSGESPKSVQQDCEKSLTISKLKTSSARPGDDLPPDSDEENSPSGQRTNRISSKPVLSERSANIGSAIEVPNALLDKQDLDSTILSLPVRNKAFTCCIQQYGIKVQEKSYARADAGDGMRWKRMFGLFGTSII